MTNTRNYATTLLNTAAGTAALCLTLYSLPTPQMQEVRETVAENTAQTVQKLQLSASDLFKGGQKSLVAIATGSAEGTRTPDGQFTRYYNGHVDPGNGVWNLGSFSYQHGAKSPEEADQKQLARLRRQWELSEAEARAKGLKLDTFLVLAGIDLWNQAPLAGQDYIKNLEKCRDKKIPKIIALCARIESYKNPVTGRFEAPGLGNNWFGVHDDQLRRIEEIERAERANANKSR